MTRDWPNGELLFALNRTHINECRVQFDVKTKIMDLLEIILSENHYKRPSFAVHRDTITDLKDFSNTKRGVINANWLYLKRKYCQ